MADNLRIDGLPTLLQLLAFPGEGGPINVAEQIGVYFTTFGILLLNDDTGAVVQAIARQHMLNAEQINMEIFRRWLQGSGRRPVVWQTLVECLDQAGLKRLAEIIQARLERSVPAGLVAIVTDEFQTSEPQELSLKIGDVITNVKMCANGWWEGVLNGRKGLFPSSFVQLQSR
eukprot:Em0003g684a